MKILDGRPVAAHIQQNIRDTLSKPFVRPPCLVAVLSTDHPASLSYVERKVRACQEVGITSRVIQIAPRDTQEFLDLIDSLNEDERVDGILIQLPIPMHLDFMEVLQRVDPAKDVDGFHPIN